MKFLLITAAIVGMMYFFMLGGNKKAEEETIPESYQRQMDKAENIEKSMQESVDKRLMEH